MRVWTTNHLPPADQFAFWREVLCEAFTALEPIVAAERRRHPFECHVAKKDILGVSVTQVASRAQTVVHGQREVRRTCEDVFFLNMQISGELITAQDERSIRMQPGDFCLVDTTRPYELRFTDWRTLSLRIPRHLLVPALRQPDAVTAVRLGDDGRMGTLVGNFVRSLLSCPENLPVDAQQALVQSLVSLVASAFGPSGQMLERTRDRIRAELRNAVVAYVNTHIANPELSTTLVARRFGVSPRYLQKVFEDAEHTFADTVSRARLQRVADELRSPASRNKAISQIAYQWGFADFSSFCRAFRRRYGISAGEFRDDPEQISKYPGPIATENSNLPAA